MSDEPQKSAKEQYVNSVVYHVTLTYLNIASLIGLVCSILLIKYGINGLRTFPVEAEDPFRYISGYIPLVFAVIIIIGIITMYIFNARRRIGINDKHFVYSNGVKKPIVMKWKQKLMVSVPLPGKKSIFDKATVSDGVHIIQFERFFFKHFDKICIVLKDRQGAIQSENSEGYKL